MLSPSLGTPPSDWAATVAGWSSASYKSSLSPSLSTYRNDTTSLSQSYCQEKMKWHWEDMVSCLVLLIVFAKEGISSGYFFIWKKWCDSSFLLSVFFFFFHVSVFYWCSNKSPQMWSPYSSQGQTSLPFPASGRRRLHFLTGGAFWSSSQQRWLRLSQAASSTSVSIVVSFSDSDSPPATFSWKDPCSYCGPTKLIQCNLPFQEPESNHICKVLFAM